MKKKKYLCVLLLFILLMCSAVTVCAAGSKAGRGKAGYAAVPKLNKSRIEILCGKSVNLKSSQKVTWNSSDTSVAVVSANGKVKAVGCGNAKIYAVNKNGRKSVCKVTVTKYTVTKVSSKKTPAKVNVYANGSYKNYTVYNKLAFENSAVRSRGCSFSAVATVMSAYGLKCTPQDIHLGSVKSKYSECYAWKKAEGYSSIGKKPLTIYAMSEILKNAGIKCKAVYKYQDSDAVQQITKNLEAGRPVIVRVNGNKAKGAQFTKKGAHHYITLAGIDEDGYVIVLDSIGGLVNKSKYSGKYRLTVAQIVKNFMAPCKGNFYKSFYTGKNVSNGGYILITK